MKNIKIGDRITFKAATRDHYRKATRVVNGVWAGTGMPTVRYNGWPDFVVRFDEIIAINGRPAK